MKAKKIVVLSMAVAFVFVAILSCFRIFSVRGVEIDFTVYKNTDVKMVQQTADSFKGKSLLFLKTDEVKEELSKFSYVEVLSVEKDYPNVLKIKVKERREVYYTEVNGKYYILDQDGFVLNCVEQDALGDLREKIALSFSNVKIEKLEVGSYIKTDCDSLLKSTFKMAKCVDLTDCIKSIKIDSKIPLYNVAFTTYTGVEIWVVRAEDDGEAKIKKAFAVYESDISDYKKAFDTLIVSKSRIDGTIHVDWSDRSEIGK
ncbi:MAG: FtsQ-type POTRA domain-containing protein [Clostridia bacterium]|nr:FtsQ-type POTRA domain-containing protein [Clostridia bacterium]